MKRSGPPLLLVVAVALTGCTIPSTASDETAVHYGGGPIEAKTAKGCIPASTRQVESVADDYFYYPESQRVYDFTGGEGADAEPIAVVSSDNQNVTVPGTVNFDLNTDCEVLTRFHDNIGRRYGAYMVQNGDGDYVTGPGWSRMMNLYIGRAVDGTLDRVAKQYTWRQLYSDPAIKDELNTAVNETVAALVDQQTDGQDEFFANYTALVGQPVLDETLAQALKDEESKVAQARADQAAAVAQAEAARAAADAQVAQKNAEIVVAEAEARRRAAEIAPYGTAAEYNNAQAIAKGLNPYQPSYGAGTLVTPPAEP